MTLSVSNALPGGEAGRSPADHGKLAIFFSHSSQDIVVVRALVQLLHAGLHIRSSEIRCTSLEGYRLKAGASVENDLRAEVNSATVFIGLITPSSVVSRYVMMEVGARWQTKQLLVPLVRCKEDMALVGGPLAGLNALDISQSAQLLQFVEDVARYLELTPECAAAYDGHVKAVLAALDSSRNESRRERASPLRRWLCRSDCHQ